VGIIFGRGVSLVVVELDRPFSDVEGEFAIVAVVDLPAGVGLAEKIIDQRFDGLANGQGLTLDLGLSQVVRAISIRSEGSRMAPSPSSTSMRSIWPLSP
jgi:hypothetical protein